jgi:hypothetical protein
MLLNILGETLAAISWATVDPITLLSYPWICPVSGHSCVQYLPFEK